ncbi:hypothetical protein DY000_02021090 [Brassica cretica]|uniref:Uncharacterized protein n=1 Tax=Brassica cretica TaxID=69181 RepID=A0ABQ7E0Z1_BRACR|nr:hypothetical protein DY000_02021090 [Brassica cretica]
MILFLDGNAIGLWKCKELCALASLGVYLKEHGSCFKKDKLLTRYLQALKKVLVIFKAKVLGMSQNVTMQRDILGYKVEISEMEAWLMVYRERWWSTIVASFKVELCSWRLSQWVNSKRRVGKQYISGFYLIYGSSMCKEKTKKEHELIIDKDSRRDMIEEKIHMQVVMHLSKKTGSVLVKGSVYTEEFELQVEHRCFVSKVFLARSHRGYYVIGRVITVIQGSQMLNVSGGDQGRVELNTSLSLRKGGVIHITARRKREMVCRFITSQQQEDQRIKSGKSKKGSDGQV